MTFPNHPASGWNPGTLELFMLHGEEAVEFGDQKVTVVPLFHSVVRKEARG